MSSTDPQAAPPAEPAPEAGALLEQFDDPIGDLKAAVTDLTAAFRVWAASSIRSPGDLSCYRTINAARGLQECQVLLDQGWELIHPDFCEEVRRRSGAGRQPSVMAWTPYFILGRRDTLMPEDRQAILQADEQRAMSSGMPLPDQAETEAPPPTAPPADGAGEGSGQPPVGTVPGARGRRVTAASPTGRGFETTGALQGR